MTTTDISLALLLGPQLEAFRHAGYDVVGVSAPGPFVADLASAGIGHVPLAHATRSFSLADDALAALELFRLFRRLRPDIVHTHNPKPGVYGRVAARCAGVPVVVNTVHGLYATPGDPLARRGAVYAMERLAASCSDAELVQNPEDLEVLASLGVPRRRLHLLGNGVDLDRFDAGSARSAEGRRRVRAALGAGEDTVVVGAVGRLVWEKGYSELFAAASELRRRDPHVMFVVAGPDDPAKADGIGPGDRARAEAAGVRFLGHRSDVEDLYAALDVYVLASHREGFPRSAMEAAAMALPIVATDIRGCRQVVEDGVTGLLVSVRDSAALAGAIGRLAGDGELRRSMGGRAAAKARREFDQRQVIGVTLGVYERLLAGTRPGGPANSSPTAQPAPSLGPRPAGH
ncbi:MAG: glycosyltransferase family 4 protein [Acidimicrobiales bacterium]